MSIRDEFFKRLAAPDPPAMDTVRDILRLICADCTTLDEVRADVAAQFRVSRRPVDRELRALEAVLAAKEPPVGLGRMVAWEGNWVLYAPKRKSEEAVDVIEDASDARAFAFLGDLLAIYREVTGAAD